MIPPDQPAVPPPPPGVPPAPANVSVPPIPAGYTAERPPLAGGRGRRNRRLLIVFAVIVVLVAAAFVGVALSSHNSRYTIVSSSSTDGTFTAGDCVSLSATRVTKSDCGSAHDAQIIQVIHAGQVCPRGTQEFDVTDNTGNLCLDRGNSSKG